MRLLSLAAILLAELTGWLGRFRPRGPLTVALRLLLELRFEVWDTWEACDAYEALLCWETDLWSDDIGSAASMAVAIADEIESYWGFVLV